MYKVLNGVKVDLTEAEIAEYNAKKQEWDNNKHIRQLAEIRQLRLEKLKETDYLANSDVVMPDNIKTWRQSLRDLPQDNTTEEQYDLILVRDESNNLTNVVWSKP